MKSSALLLYRTIQLVLLPFIAPYFAVRLLRDRNYRSHFPERLGWLPQSFTRTNSGAIWLHAVSLGEVASAVPLIRTLKTETPSVPVYLSTSTVAGRKAALHQTEGLVDGVFYCPVDYAWCVRRVLRALKPSLVIILETEIWPNLYAQTKRTGAKLASVNGRISNRTWPRYRAWRRWICPILKLPDLILAQSSVDYERYIKLGAPHDKVGIAPNLKYELPSRTGPTDISTFGARHVWIAASTTGPNERGSSSRHSVDEDDLVTAAFEALAPDFPKLLLILAPRQPARFDHVARKLTSRNINFLRRTAYKADTTLTLSLPGVLLLDTVGELSGLYSLGDVAFVGGSFAPRGGHNILEPAAAGSPIIVGPHMENFASIAQDFLDAKALIQLQNPAELAATIRALLNDPERAHTLGAKARDVVTTRQGGARQIAAALWPLYHGASVHKEHAALGKAIRAPLRAMWVKGGHIKKRQSERFALAARPLPTPVISVGGITLGGSGKTPFTVYLAKLLKRRGYSPAILTRGYRRRSMAEHLIFPPGAEVPAAVTGDESQILIRRGEAPVGIGAKRYETAQILLRQFPNTDVLLLDDGFQHFRLQRDFDIVLIDGLDPFGGEDVVPVGRLREPLSGLKRAHAFVVTRAEHDLRFQSISQRLRLINPAAKIFRTRLVCGPWRDSREGQTIEIVDGCRVGAFCALGNPGSFWQTLESLDLNVVFRWSFVDHHVYNPSELQRVSRQAQMHGATLLVTTEKDRINCPNQLGKSIAPLDLAWLQIELELDDESTFLDLLGEIFPQGRETRAIS